MTFTYFITGANRGIGLSIVDQLSKNKEDVKIIASTRNPAKSTELKKLADSTGKVEIVELDVSSQESIGKLAAQLEKLAPDGIDFFIGNAGVAAPLRKAIEASYETYLDMFKTNVLGNVFVFKVVYPFLLKKDTKKVAFTSSGAGSLTQFLEFPMAPYAMSKTSVNYLTKSLALDHGSEGFTFVAIHPGLVKTDMSVDALNTMDAETQTKIGVLEPTESASSMIKIYDSITPADSGKFYNFDGTEYPL